MTLRQGGGGWIGAPLARGAQNIFIAPRVATNKKCGSQFGTLCVLCIFASARGIIDCIHVGVALEQELPPVTQRESRIVLPIENLHEKNDAYLCGDCKIHTMRVVVPGCIFGTHLTRIFKSMHCSRTCRLRLRSRLNAWWSQYS